MLKISERQFATHLKERLGKHYDRGLKLFFVCGENFSFDLASILFWATDQEEEIVEEILDLLEEHFEEHLQQQTSLVEVVQMENGLTFTRSLWVEISDKVLGRVLSLGPVVFN